MPVITVLLIGSTGGGKSTICNVLADRTDLFVEGETSISVTKDHQVATVQVDEQLTLRIVDTVGLGDTSLTEEQVLFRIARACYDIRDGLNRVFFVTSSRFTRTEIEVYDIMRTVIFNNDITRFVTIVRTNFAQFMDANACRNDIQRLKSENPTMREILDGCNDSMIHVNNPSELAHPNWHTLRSFSRQLLHSLLRTCTEGISPALHLYPISFELSVVYSPPQLQVITERIRGHVEEATKFERQNAELREALERQQADMEETRARLAKSEENFMATIRDFQNTQLELARQHRSDVEDMARQRREMDAAHARDKAELMAHIERVRQEAERTRQREAEIQAQLNREREQAAAQMRQVMEQQARTVVVQGGGGGDGGGGGGRRPNFLEKAFIGVGRAVGRLVPRCSVM